MASRLQSSPPLSPNSSYLLSYPAPYVLLVTINRPKHMNCLPYAAHWEADAIFRWFDNEPSLRVAVITGAGPKAFCAGQDLVEQSQKRAAHDQSSALKLSGNLSHPSNGFMGISRRRGKKPVVAAVNGFALGGGFEICLNWYRPTSFVLHAFFCLHAGQPTDGLWDYMFI
jgi:enoyl-CoA hydratase/carnithine racemase